MDVGPREVLHRLLRVLKRWWAPAFFALIALHPVIARIRHPTLLGDDVTRVVELIEQPLGALLVRPFNEHLAPLFDFVSWSTWQAIGHDIRLAPLGFCIASVLPWVLLLALLTAWLKRETGSSTAALVTVALAAQSPLALEAMWWYSAASFTYAVLGVQAALLGATLLASRPRPALILIGVGSALGPTASTIGVLGMPLAVLRTLIDPKTTWRGKAQGTLAAFGGLGIYLIMRELIGAGLFQAAPRQAAGFAEPITGLGYAITVPGRILWPAMAGVPASWMVEHLPAGLAWLLGALALAAILTLAINRRAKWNRRLVIVGGAMIYLGYALTYCARAGLVRMGEWTEPQLLYDLGGRYHLLPLLGACAIIAGMLAASPLVRRSDGVPGRPALIGIIVGLLALAVNRNEEEHWRWMMQQPDEKATLAALHRVGELARAEGISRDQLTKIFDPVFRPWNGSVRLNPYYFHFMKLVAQAPLTVDRPIPDEQARVCLLSRLTLLEQSVLASGACVSMGTKTAPNPEAQALVVARRIKLEHVREVRPGSYRSAGWPAFIEYEFDSSRAARFLTLPGLAADQDLTISWRNESGQWRPLHHVCWLKTPAPVPAAAIDLHRLANWPTGRAARIRVEFTCPGELALQQPPRLLR
jgi:hypothetical protein